MIVPLLFLRSSIVDFLPVRHSVPRGASTPQRRSPLLHAPCPVKKLILGFGVSTQSDSFELVLWDDLQAFVGAAEAGSLSAVARRLGCTQPAVGQRVRRLERELGVALLERRRSGVVLTTAGTALYEAAVDATGRLHTALETVRRLRGDERPLRVAAADILARWFMIAPPRGVPQRPS